jgi:hypothetical protein
MTYVGRYRSEAKVYIPYFRRPIVGDLHYTMPPTPLQLAKSQLATFLNQGDKAVFSRQDLRVLLSQNRTVWHLARSTTV